jgi:hypothetical protein
MLSAWKYGGGCNGAAIYISKLYPCPFSVAAITIAVITKGTSQ